MPVTVSGAVRPTEKYPVPLKNLEVFLETGLTSCRGFRSDGREGVFTFLDALTVCVGPSVILCISLATSVVTVGNPSALLSTASV